MSKNKFEKGLSEKLDGYESNMDFDQLWTELEPKVSKEKPSRRFGFIWFFGVLLFILFTSLYLDIIPFSSSNSNLSVTSTLENKIHNQPSSNDIESPKTSLHNSQKTKEKNLVKGQNKEANPIKGENVSVRKSIKSDFQVAKEFKLTINTEQNLTNSDESSQKNNDKPSLINTGKLKSKDNSKMVVSESSFDHGQLNNQKKSFKVIKNETKSDLNFLPLLSSKIELAYLEFDGEFEFNPVKYRRKAQSENLLSVLIGGSKSSKSYSTNLQDFKPFLSSKDLYETPTTSYSFNLLFERKINDHLSFSTGIEYLQTREEFDFNVDEIEVVTLEDETFSRIHFGDGTTVLRYGAVEVDFYTKEINKHSYFSIPVQLSYTINPESKIPISLFSGFSFSVFKSVNGHTISNLTDPYSKISLKEVPYRNFGRTMGFVGIDINLKLKSKNSFVFGFKYSSDINGILNEAANWQEKYKMFGLHIGYKHSLNKKLSAHYTPEILNVN